MTVIFLHHVCLTSLFYKLSRGIVFARIPASPVPGVFSMSGLKLPSLVGGSAVNEMRGVVHTWPTISSPFGSTQSTSLSGAIENIVWAGQRITICFKLVSAAN